MRRSSLLAIAAMSALAVGGGSTPRAGMGGTRMSPEDRARRDAEKLGRRAFKLAAAEAKRDCKAAKRRSQGKR